MCGICGYIGINEAILYLITGIKILQNRGYDSAGICTINKNNCFTNTKYASDAICAIKKLENNLDLHKNSKIGISHTRWATHGGKTDKNSHPHIDCKNRFAVVHNGIIENYKELKNSLIKNNYSFISETDTEIIPNLVSYYVEEKCLSVEKAIIKIQEVMIGTWGVVLLDLKEPDSLYIFRNGSPLLIGYNESIAIIASEKSAFNNKISDYISVKNKEIIKLYKKENKIFKKIIGKNELKLLTDTQKSKKIDKNELIIDTPEPYRHWTIREIFEIPISVLKSINNGGRLLNDTHVKLGGLEMNLDKILKIKYLIIIACGSSLFAGMIGKIYLEYLKSFMIVEVIDATEFSIEKTNNKYFSNEEIGILAISQSGETRDILDVIKKVKTKNIFCMGIINVVGSQIAEETNCGIYLNSGREVGVASTKSFVNQSIILLLFAIWIAQNQKKSIDKRRIAINDIKNFTLYSSQIFKKYNSCKKIARMLKNHNSCFILSSGFLEIISKEAALKLKELCYIHAEGYSIGSLKHGPLAMISNGTIIFYISSSIDINFCKKIEIAASETKSRGSVNILITDYENHNTELFKEIIYLPKCNLLSPCASIIIFQLIAYELSIQKGINPDKPRNLAKTVTVS